MQHADALYLFNEGRNHQAYRLLGAHVDAAGTTFRVWAPNAGRVSVIGDFNGWHGDTHPLQALGESGVWAATVAQAGPNNLYRCAALHPCLGRCRLAAATCQLGLAAGTGQYLRSACRFVDAAC